MLMLSEVSIYLISILSRYGDIPCILESPTQGKDGVYFLPLENIPIMTVYSNEYNHKETAVLFTSQRISS